MAADSFCTEGSKALKKHPILPGLRKKERLSYSLTSTRWSFTVGGEDYSLLEASLIHFHQVYPLPQLLSFGITKLGSLIDPSQFIFHEESTALRTSDEKRKQKRNVSEWAK